VAVPPTAEFRLSEVRSSGLGVTVPDLVRVYAGPREDKPNPSSVAIFSGQDMGKICYTWLNPTTVQLSMSGGYPEWIEPSARINGKTLSVQFIGAAPNCVWRRGDPS
jgi:hypothetical protein